MEKTIMSTAIEQETEPHVLKCMEIWGGNDAVDTAVSLTGIDAWIFSQPYAGNKAGGDIHYLSMCGHGRLSRFTVADVSGHGNQADQLAATLRSLMRKNINTLDQTRFAQTLNHEFAKLEESGRFATALMATYFAPTDQLIICNAGHPPPLWFRWATKQWQFLEHNIPNSLDNVANLPLGIIEPTDYYQFAVKLDKGDLILIYTDSMIESKNPTGEQLGQEGLIESVKKLDTTNHASVCGQLVNQVAQYRRGVPADDDVTVLLLHHNADDPPKQSVGDMMKVMGKMMGLIKV